jgi:hypothetical protein
LFQVELVEIGIAIKGLGQAVVRAARGQQLCHAGLGCLWIHNGFLQVRSNDSGPDHEGERWHNTGDQALHCDRATTRRSPALYTRGLVSGLAHDTGCLPVFVGVYLPGRMPSGLFERRFLRLPLRGQFRHFTGFPFNRVNARNLRLPRSCDRAWRKV